MEVKINELKRCDVCKNLIVGTVKTTLGGHDLCEKCFKEFNETEINGLNFALFVDDSSINHIVIETKRLGDTVVCPCCHNEMIIDRYAVKITPENEYIKCGWCGRKADLLYWKKIHNEH